MIFLLNLKKISQLGKKHDALFIVHQNAKMSNKKL